MNECPSQSAIREAMEEGGVVGHLGRCLGTFDNSDRRHRTRVYVLNVSHLLVRLFPSQTTALACNCNSKCLSKDDFDDKDRRVRQWFSIEEARKILDPHKPSHLKYLTALTASKVDDVRPYHEELPIEQPRA